MIANVRDLKKFRMTVTEAMIHEGYKSFHVKVRVTVEFSYRNARWKYREPFHLSEEKKEDQF